MKIVNERSNAIKAVTSPKASDACPEPREL